MHRIRRRNGRIEEVGHYGLTSIVVQRAAYMNVVTNDIVCVSPTKFAGSVIKQLG